MINTHTMLVNALKGILPTYYEMKLTSNTETPCISYMELSNIAEETGDTIGYSRIVYQIKVWGTDIGKIQYYASLIDATLRPIGFKRTGCNEMADNNSAMIQKIMSYEAKAKEKYN